MKTLPYEKIRIFYLRNQECCLKDSIFKTVEFNMWQGTNSTEMVVRPIEKSSQIRTRVTERVKEQDTINSIFSRIWLMRDLRRFSPSFPESHRFSMPVSLGGSKECSRAAKLLIFLSTHPVKMPEVVCIRESRHHIHLLLLHPFPV